MIKKTLFLLLLTLLGKTPVVAQNYFYISTSEVVNNEITNNTSEIIYRVNTNDCSKEKVFEVRSKTDFCCGILDIALNYSDNYLYVIVSNIAELKANLIKINLTNGQYEQVGEIPPVGLNASTFNVFNNLYFSSVNENSIYVVKKPNKTDDFNFLGKYPEEYGYSAGDLTFVDRDLYLSTVTGNIVKIDTNNVSASTILMNTGLHLSCGLSSNCNDLYIYDDNDIYVINVKEPSFPILVCENITENLITGASTIFEKEYEYDVTILGNDSICSNVPLENSLKVNSYYSKLEWSTGDTLNQISIKDTGTYWVKQSNICGESMDSIHVTHRELPKIGNLDTTVMCFPLRYDLENKNYSYQWFNQSNESKVEIENAGDYWVSANDGFCTDTSFFTVFQSGESLTPPNTITPNGDGKNDFFTLENTNGVSAKLEIYNRWGELIYKTEEYQNNWQPQSSGVYYYLAMTGTCESKGWVMSID
ncbi:MAG: hypothetical protein RLZZ546_2577 [Bacteroidota bacterium]|jgi:gliding motility-associated-like protein